MVWAAIDSRGGCIIRHCPINLDGPAYQAVLQSALGFIRRRATSCVFQQVLNVLFFL